MGRKRLVIVLLIVFFSMTLLLGCTEEMVEEIKQDFEEEASKEIERIKDDIVSDINERKDQAVDDAKSGIDSFFSKITNDFKEWFGGLFRRPKQTEPGPADPKPVPEISPEELAQIEANQMTIEQFKVWKKETGWNDQNGWPPLPAAIDISGYKNPEKVDSFYGVDAMVRNKLYLGNVGEKEGKYACAEYIKRFYQAYERHGLFGSMPIENVTNLMPGAVPNITYYENGTKKNVVMSALNLEAGELPRPGDICYKYDHGYGHWMIVRGIDSATNEVVIVEQNYHDGKIFQPARRLPVSECTYYRVPW